MIAPRLRVYIAARGGRRDEMRQIAQLLEGEGIVVTSRWHSDDAAWDLGQKFPARGAELDLEDIDQCSGVLSFTEEPGQPPGTGGRHFEMGWAHCRGKWLWVIGPREHVFHHLGKVRVFPTLADWMAVMLRMPKREVRAALRVAK